VSAVPAAAPKAALRAAFGGGLGDASRAAAAHAAEGASAFERQYLSFYLDGQIYAVPLAQVAEIVPYQELNQIPHMPKSVEGILDLRGQVIPVISLRTRMGLEKQEAGQAKNIVVLSLGTASPIGVLVDAVDAVLTAQPDQLVSASLLLAGPEGAWVRGFVIQAERIIALLDSRLITTFHTSRVHLETADQINADHRLDEGLKELIALAPFKVETDSHRIIPQMEEAIAHTEQEMSKVMDRVESMLASTDKGFQGLVRLKQEAALGHMKGHEGAVAEIEKLGTELQDQVFNLIQILQYQDIARQKLERVLNHIRGLQMIVGSKFRDQGKKLV
jgi:purine-binding chemotaxis protein CheW